MAPTYFVSVAAIVAFFRIECCYNCCN
jgi:hypothetical protein